MNCNMDTRTHVCTHLYLREYNDWIMVKLQHINDLVTQGEELIQRAENFVECFPLEDPLLADSEALLKEADQLVANQDQLHQIEVECGQVEEQLLVKQIQQETVAGFSGQRNLLDFFF